MSTQTALGDRIRDLHAGAIATQQDPIVVIHDYFAEKDSRVGSEEIKRLLWRYVPGYIPPQVTA